MVSAETFFAVILLVVIVVIFAAIYQSVAHISLTTLTQEL